MPAEQVRTLGRSLSGRAGTAEEVRARLGDEAGVDGPLRTPVALFLACHGTLAAALAAELDRLGTTVTDVAGSWLQLDAALVPGAEHGP